MSLLSSRKNCIAKNSGHRKGIERSDLFSVEIQSVLEGICHVLVWTLVNDDMVLRIET